MSNKITAVLNGYKRGEHLQRQVDAINNQTLKPEEILLWQNAGGYIEPDLGDQTTWASCNKNFGVWARFAYALNAKTEYICVFDDDTIPGSKWFENCINTMKTHEGLLGTVGLIFTNTENYWPIIRPGWPTPNEQTVQADYLGHAWFFKREWLSAFWRELPDPEQSMIVGEDMHFSAMLQKYMNINTYVPPHPRGDKELWGSQPELAWEIGQDENAISMNLENIDLMTQEMKKYRKGGWKFVLEDQIK
tara:strand:- start:710 stop:1453 length:744 start_codon:yes stop_codon:yes gene_type:complete